MDKEVFLKAMSYANEAEMDYFLETMFTHKIGVLRHKASEIEKDEYLKNNLEAVKLLIKAGVDFTNIDNEAIRNAAFGGHTGIFKELIEKGANPLEVGYPDFIKAISEGYSEIVKIMIDAGYDFKFNANEALIRAVVCDKLEIVKMLVDAGADISAQGNSPVYDAAAEGHIEILKYLIEKGCDVVNDLDPLDIASRNGQLGAVKIIVETGANPNGLCALRNAAEMGHLDVTKYLVEKGASVTLNDNSALSNAAYNGKKDVVLYLLENGANKGNLDDAIFFAGGRDNEDIIEILKAEKEKCKLS